MPTNAAKALQDLMLNQMQEEPGSKADSNTVSHLTGNPVSHITDLPTDQQTVQPTDQSGDTPVSQMTGVQTDTPTAPPTDIPTDRPADRQTDVATVRPSGKSADPKTDPKAAATVRTLGATPMRPITLKVPEGLTDYIDHHIHDNWKDKVKKQDLLKRAMQLLVYELETGKELVKIDER